MVKIRRWCIWYLQTSMVIGMPITALLIILFVQYGLFTFTCYSAGYYCQYAVTSDPTQAAIEKIMRANPGMDISLTPGE